MPKHPPDPGDRLLALALAPVAAVYRLGVALRNAAYDHRRLSVRSAGLPVICVGNLSVGGTGKTPVCDSLARLATAWGFRPAIIARGYGAAGADANDEMRMLAERLPGLIQAAHPDRLRAALDAKSRGATVVIMDDGFGHRRLHRDIDLLVFDVSQAGVYSPGRLLPAGRLREPLSSMTRAHAFLLTRCRGPEDERADRFEALCRLHAPGRPVFRAGTRVERWRTLDHRPLDLSRAGDAPMIAFAGIGNPRAFEETLARAGFVLAAPLRMFADHHPYRAEDLAALVEDARRRGLGESRLICTHKDAVKLAPLARATGLGIGITVLEVAPDLGPDAKPFARWLRGALSALHPLQSPDQAH